MLAEHRTQCEQALTDLREDADAYEGLRTGNGKVASRIADADVQDAGTVKTLEEQMDATAPTMPACTAMSADELEATVAQIDDHHEWYEAHSDSLKEAIEGVRASKQAKAVAERAAQLADTLTEARTLLDLTRGQVKDQATWEALEDLVNEGESVAAGSDMDAMDASETKLRDAMAKVTASNDAKKADDEKKAQEAAKKAEQAKEEALKKAEELKKKVDEKRTETAASTSHR
ncbi:MAG: hypothetical protein UHD09_06935 [Bifidobacterium sp.]|nr:hypothetical protein [Bifidobacterium sp.]